MFNQTAIIKKKIDVSGTRYIIYVYIIFVFAVWNNSHNKTSFGSILWEESRPAKNEQRRSGNEQTTGTSCQSKSWSVKICCISYQCASLFSRNKREKTIFKDLAPSPKSLFRGKKTTPKLQTSIMQGTVLQTNLPSSTFHLHKILGTFPFLKVYLCSIQSWLITSTKWHPTCAARSCWISRLVEPILREFLE